MSSQASGSNALWGSRFDGGPSEALAALSRSVHFDWRLASYDIAGTRAHIKTLQSAGYLTVAEHEKLDRSLVELNDRVVKGSFVAKQTDEDVHSALERGLIEIAGVELGGKVRAGRSRNDQIATLIRTYLLDQATVIAELVTELVEILVTRAEENLGVAMPGRTHFQHAQPVALSHHLLAHAWPLTRDLDRLSDWRVRASLSP
jgi:argininosuccinate lyase